MKGIRGAQEEGKGGAKVAPARQRRKDRTDKGINVVEAPKWHEEVGRAVEVVRDGCASKSSSVCTSELKSLRERHDAKELPTNSGGGAGCMPPGG